MPGQLGVKAGFFPDSVLFKLALHLAAQLSTPFSKESHSMRDLFKDAQLRRQKVGKALDRVGFVPTLS